MTTDEPQLTPMHTTARVNALGALEVTCQCTEATMFVRFMPHATGDIHRVLEDYYRNHAAPMRARPQNTQRKPK